MTAFFKKYFIREEKARPRAGARERENEEEKETPD